MPTDAAPVILVVDDDESARRLVRMGLELEGAVVVEAETLTRARQFLNRRMDGVVLDRELPDGDGLELLADIGATCPDVPIVVNSTLDDGREPAWVAKVDKGDLPGIVAGLDLAAIPAVAGPTAVIDLVRAEAEAVALDWEELCKWDPVLPPDSVPPVARLVVDAVVEALQRPQPLGWGPDPALASITELFAASAGAVDVAVGQLVCLREAFRRHLATDAPGGDVTEMQARVDMVIDRAIWTACRVAAARMQRQATVDHLTGVGNQRAFDGDLVAELGRARRYQRALTVMVGAINGSVGGDSELTGPLESQLRRLAGTLATNVRAQDGVYRLDGATFALILPETDLDQAQALVDRLSDGLASLNVTIGAASYPADGDNPVTLVHEAEQRRPVTR